MIGQDGLEAPSEVEPAAATPIVTAVATVATAVASETTAEKESSRSNVEFVHPMSSKRSLASQRALSMNSVLPAMELMWHGINVKPRTKSHSYSDAWWRIFLPSSSSHPNHSVENGKDGGGFKSSSDRKYILEGVFGVAYPGEVLALMGSSGAGKTTLLNVLTNRNLSSMKATGSIRLNGCDADRNLLKRMSAYVQQDDLFVGSMTVVEHLRFMATLRMGRHYSSYEREKRVQSVMAELNLKKSANTLIGWPNRKKGLSGGERKRLAFASEIMTGPPILFCDEPTSGLDSFLAQQVIGVLKHLAKRKQMTVICTIHQPSSQLFEMFDKVCFLAEGKLAFLGTTLQATALWEQIGYPLPENYNPADHFISTLAINSASRKCRARIIKICDGFAASEEGKRLLEKSKGDSSHATTTSSSSSSSFDGGGGGGDGRGRRASAASIEEPPKRVNEGQQQMMRHRYQSTWLQQFGQITKRSFFSTVRDPMLLRVRIFQIIIISFLIGLVYWHTPVKQSTVMNINGVLFILTSNIAFMFIFASVNVFCEELPIFMREHGANLYRVSSYFLAKNVAELPQYLLYPILYATISYWMAGLEREITAFLFFTLSCVLICNIAISISYAVSCVFGKYGTAIGVMPVIVIPLLAFGGFYIQQESLPFYFRPVKYLSFFGYAYQTTAINEWSRIGNIPGCSEMRRERNASAGGGGGGGGGPAGGATTHCYKNGEEVLKSLSFNPDNFYPAYAIMALMIVVVRTIAFVGLLVRAKTKK